MTRIANEYALTFLRRGWCSNRWLNTEFGNIPASDDRPNIVPCDSEWYSMFIGCQELEEDFKLHIQYRNQRHGIPKTYLVDINGTSTRINKIDKWVKLKGNERKVEKYPFFKEGANVSVYLEGAAKNPMIYLYMRDLPPNSVRFLFDDVRDS